MLPLFRSDGQARLLARVYLAPDRPAPLSQLARELNLDAGGLTREADRLEEAGLLHSRRIGRQRLLEPNADSIYYPELHSLLRKAFGPATVIGPALAGVAGVERAMLFGSWAARYLGEPGAEPGDIDLLVIGDAPRRQVAAVAARLSTRLDRMVNATILSPERWEAAGRGFRPAGEEGTATRARPRPRGWVIVVNERELLRLVRDGVVERVEPDQETARQEIRTARIHLTSARLVGRDDPTGAFSMAYDAMRKAIAAHLREHGYRVKTGRGHHLRTGRYAVAALAHLDLDDHLDAIDELRQLRNQSEHDALLIEPEDVDDVLVHAHALVEAIAVELGA